MNYVLCIKRVIKKGIVVIPLFILLNSLFTRETLAHCPLCVAGAAAGVGDPRAFRGAQLRLGGRGLRSDPA